MAARELGAAGAGTTKYGLAVLAAVTKAYGDKLLFENLDFIVIDELHAYRGVFGSHLTNVLRLKSGDPVLVFNGKDGEWRAELALYGKKVSLELREQTREQPGPRDLHYLFAPLKHERLDYMMQKAVEMGATRLVPVLTQHTQVNRVNTERMRANAIEAAEQCGVLSIPDIGEPMTFARAMAARKPDRLLVFCDEAADVKAPIATLADAREAPTAMLPLTMSAAGSAPRMNHS